jgi:hypothetical protein
VFPHDSLDSTSTHFLSLSIQRGMHSGAAVGLATLCMLALDLLQQHRIALCSFT